MLFNTYIRELPKACTTETVQFADDVTSSKADKNLDVVVSELKDSYDSIQNFCNQKGLSVNAAKTQLIIFKQPTRRIPADCSIMLGDCTVKLETSVKLLGVHLDQHLTMATHVDKTVKKCHGLLGVLSRASATLSQKLLKLAYTALIRTQMEYASAVVSMGSNSQLKKFDIVQKAAARIIMGAPKLAQSDPLLEHLVGLLPSLALSHVGCNMRSSWLLTL